MSGLKHVELWYQYTSGGSWANSGLTATGASSAFSFAPVLGDGDYYFALVAEDNSGNRSAAAAGEACAGAAHLQGLAGLGA